MTKQYGGWYMTLTLKVPAMSPAARDLVELVRGTHSASADLSPVKSDRNVYHKNAQLGILDKTIIKRKTSINFKSGSANENFL